MKERGKGSNIGGGKMVHHEAEQIPSLAKIILHSFRAVFVFSLLILKHNKLIEELLPPPKHRSSKVLPRQKAGRRRHIRQVTAHFGREEGEQNCSYSRLPGWRLCWCKPCVHQKAELLLEQHKAQPRGAFSEREESLGALQGPAEQILPPLAAPGWDRIPAEQG